MASKTRGEPRARTIALAVIVGIGVVAIFAGVAAKPAAGSHVDPVFMTGNVDCADLGYASSIKFDPPDSGTKTDGFGNSITVDADGTYFDWSSNFGIDVVIVKGGPDANTYSYSPESTGDDGLHSPINANNGNPFALSHIEFCFDYEVSVSKTAQTSFTRTYDWDIDKSVSPSSWDLFAGDSGTSQYTVSATKTGFTDSNWAVTGSITIANDTPFAATVESVSDLISGAGAAAVDCGASFPISIASGGSLSCSYSSALPDGSGRVNTATVATSGAVGGGSGSADVTFGSPSTEVNASINVDDTNGSSWQFGDSGTVSYTKTFSCDGDEGQHGNTATIRETGESDSASVVVRCHELAVRKDASTSLKRTWTWTIDKSADQSSLLLSPGQLFAVNYSVEVSAVSADSDWGVAGTIVVSNPNPSLDATLTSVADIVAPDIAASVSCPSLTVPAGGTLACTYSADLPNADSRLNTAAATQQNYAYDASGSGTASGTTSYTGSANVDFANASVEQVDECIDASDSNVGSFGSVCAADAPKTFAYSLTFGQHPDAGVQLECGDASHDNVASFVTGDTGAAGSDTWTVDATVACDLGCTLTPGYWKTHSQDGPAPYDDAWLNLGAAQEDTPFFLSGTSYHGALWTAPQGNAYWILAHAYIAAQLNMLNGASVPADVQAAFDAATALLSAKTPAEVAGLKGGARNAWINAAATLDGYNNGLSGPGHCDE